MLHSVNPGVEQWGSQNDIRKERGGQGSGLENQNRTCLASLGPVPALHDFPQAPLGVAPEHRKKQSQAERTQSGKDTYQVKFKFFLSFYVSMCVGWW